MSKRVLVAMSGGVDSSVTAALLVEQGYDVVGVTMRLWTKERSDAPKHHRGCCSVEDTDDARRVAGRIGFPYYVLNFEQEFEEKVVDYFVDAYSKGHTPNPCLACNQFLKFDALLRRADALGCDYIATGHYARIDHDGDKYRLLRAVDPSKDQSYVLYTLTQADLARILFPLGGLPKSKVRELAAERNLLNVAEKPDSLEICFLQGQNYRGFVEERLGPQPEGPMVDVNGVEVGRHSGISSYTVGQRKGLGIASAEPKFVIGIDALRNTVIIGSGEHLLRSECTVSDVHWLSGEAPSGPIQVGARIRYKAADAPAAVQTTPTGALVRFDAAQRAITPGQAIVFYDGDVVIGGGVITG